MPRPIGYSTGALALGEFRKALGLLRRTELCAVELSALRDAELRPLIGALDDLPLGQFTHVSFHAPSRFGTLDERECARQLRAVTERGWPVIAHPDAIADPRPWREFGPLLCLENMDKRKRTGRTVAELRDVFAAFPEASWCFDIGHARQIDPTMCESARMLRRFGQRLRQVHISEVTCRCRHEPISYTAMRAFRRVAHLIPADVPVIVEASPRDGDLDREVIIAGAALEPPSENAGRSLVSPRPESARGALHRQR